MKQLRTEFRQAKSYDEDAALEALIADASIDKALRNRISKRGIELVERIRERDDTGMMELFLSEYGLSTELKIKLRRVNGVSI